MKIIIKLIAIQFLIASSLLAQEVCDTEVLDQCKAACVSAQPACAETPPLTISEIRAIIAEKCGCTVTAAIDETSSDSCACDESVKNYGKYRSCVASLSESLKTFKLSSAEARNQLKADNMLCKSVIKSSKGNGKGKK